MTKSYLEYRQQKRIEAAERVREREEQAYRKGLEEGRKLAKKNASADRQTSK